MKKILVIEDEAMIREGVLAFLTAKGYEVKGASDGLEGYTLFQQYPFDAIVLDIMLPKMSGIQVLQEIRKTSDLPVLMLTALSDETTQLASFDAQADDYINKPFSLSVLEKRIEAVLRRKAVVHDVWKHNEICVDFTSYSAYDKEKELDIKPKEIQLLKLFLTHRGQVLTRRQILDALWNEEAPMDRVVDVYIKNLRKKLQLNCIHTIKGVGYKFDEK